VIGPKALSLDEQIGRLEDQLREWDGSNLNERTKKVETLWKLREERRADPSPEVKRRRPLSICNSCLASGPAPYEHPNVPGQKFCRDCMANMQYAEDLADSRSARRIGDAGERALMRAGRQPKGGR
jgi:hypothetical protein